MARHGDTRSPSPVGSSYSSSKRSRREEDRHDRSRRDDGRLRYRSRSRSPERRHRDRERDGYRRRDRSVERRYDDRRDDLYSHGRRDHSRDKRRDEPRRDRERDHRPRRDESRDRHRLTREDSADSKRKRRREDSRERPSKRDLNGVAKEDSKPTTPTTASAEDPKAARIAKLEAWKRRQAEEQEKKQKELEAAGGARSILNEIDRKVQLSPATASPRSPATPDVPSPAPYAGKFDPKAIVKKAHAAASTPAVLGGDIAATVLNSTATKIIASVKQNRPSSPLASVTPASSKLKARGNLSGFGITSRNAAEADKSKSAIDFGDDEDGQKKLAKLPTLPTEATNAALTNGDAAVGEDEDDGDQDVNVDVGTPEGGADEEALTAARAAAEQRSQAERGDDTTMADAPDPVPDPEPEAMEEEEEVDELDAFMSDLTSEPAKKTTFTKSQKTKNRQQEPEAIFGDDDVDLTAMDEDNPDNIMAMAKEQARKKKKDIATVNHAKITYEPFRRNFYTEPVDQSDWTEADVANFRLELDGIKVRGVDVPKPVQTWAQCGLGVQSLEVIQKLGYDAPTSIQAQAIPAIMSGRDVIGVAKTGSGKTIAFLLPMFRHIKDQRPLDSLEGPVGLILSPTRELATQIHRECKPFLKALNLRAVCAYGGAPIKDQIADLKRGAEIVVCTPGRMIDLLAANSGRVTNLKRVTYVVLDEADRMFDMGFEPQVMKILANVRPNRQTVLFSATFPRNMEALARKALAKPVEISVGGKSVVAPEITQIVEVRNDEGKFVRLLELLGNLYAEDKNEDDRALIFVDRQESADGLLRDLMRKGYPCMSIHGGKDQIDRDSTIDDFKRGIVPILIATSVAARGLDVKQLKLVVNYDAPNHLEDYVHRAGRTGRAGNTGTAVTFLTDEQDRYSVDIAKALRQSGQPVPEAVQKLVDSFMQKVKDGKEKASASASGFGGKGLERLDQERDAAKARERKTFKSGEDGDDDADKEEKTKPDAVDDDIFKKAASTVKPFADTASSDPKSIPSMPKDIMDLVNDKITVHRTERDPSSSGSSTGPKKNQMAAVAAAVAGINEKLSKAGVMRQGVPIDNKGPDAGAFHATLEINDFPQKARWAVTNRTNVAKILESTGTSITTKGSFYAAGKEPGANENPKLYILVEGDTEVVVHDAMKELLRLLREGAMAASEGENVRGGGRYSVT